MAIGRRIILSKEEFNENNATRTRYQQRSKRKKTNVILNGLIILVILLIVFVSYSIFSTNDKEKAEKKGGTQKTEQSSSSDDTPTIADSESGNEDTDSSEEQEEQDGEIITEGGSDSNVIKTIENSNWKPVGTSQTGEHIATYSEGADWNEQLQALSYATGIDSGNMTVWFLGNNNDPQKSIGTVSTKDKTEKYRVYIEWVDGSGWKPTKVEEIRDLNIR